MGNGSKDFWPIDLNELRLICRNLVSKWTKVRQSPSNRYRSNFKLRLGLCLLMDISDKNLDIKKCS